MTGDHITRVYFALLLLAMVGGAMVARIQNGPL